MGSLGLHWQGEFVFQDREGPELPNGKNYKINIGGLCQRIRISPTHANTKTAVVGACVTPSPIHTSQKTMFYPYFSYPYLFLIGHFLLKALIWPSLESVPLLSQGVPLLRRQLFDLGETGG